MKAVEAIPVAFVLLLVAIVLMSPALGLFVIAWVALFIWAKSRVSRSSRRLRVYAEIEPRLIVVGSAAKVTLAEAGAASCFGCWIHLQCRLEGPATSETLFQSLAFGKLDVPSMRIPRVLEPSRPGVYLVGPTSIDISDAFGWNPRRYDGDNATVAIAYPEPKICTFALPVPTDGFGERLNLRRTSPSGRLLIGSRPYARGDSPRSIHWRLSGHTGTLITKLLEATAEPRIWLMPCVTQAEAEDRRELCLEILVSLLRQFLEDSLEVGLVLFGSLHPAVDVRSYKQDREGLVLLPRRTDQQFGDGVTALVATLPPEHPKWVNHECFSHIQRGDVLLIVGGPYQWTVDEAISIARRRGAAVTYIVAHSAGSEAAFSQVPARGVDLAFAKATGKEIAIEFHC